MFMQPQVTSERTSIYNSGFLAYVSGDDIYQAEYFGAPRQVVGKTLKAYNELQEMANKYYEKLVELGVIAKEKTPEELAEENVRQLEDAKTAIKQNQELMVQMMAQMKELQSAVHSMQDSSLRGQLADVKDVNYYLNEEKSDGNKCSDINKELSHEFGAKGKKTGAGTGNK